MAPNRRTRVAAVLAGGLVAATLPLATNASAAGAALAAPAAQALTAAAPLQAHKAKRPKLKLSDRTLRKGDTVRLRGKRFPKSPTSLYITICGNPPGATNCDVDLRHVKQIAYKGKGKFKTKYTIAVTKFSTASGKINCKKVQCVIGTTNALNPKDHAYNSAAKFTVG